MDVVIEHHLSCKTKFWRIIANEKLLRFDHLTLHYIISFSWAFASCLPFSYRSDILWGRDGIIIDNKPWPANDTRIDCLKGATVDDGREWVTITFSGRIKKSYKVFLLFSLRTYFIFNRLLNAVFQLVYYWSHLGAI